MWRTCLLPGSCSLTSGAAQWGVSWQLWPTSGCSISTEETLNGEKSLPLSTLNRISRGEPDSRCPRHPATFSRLLQDECRRSERPGQLGAEAHRGDPQPAVRRRGVPLSHRQRRRGQGRVCWGCTETGFAVWEQPGDVERTVSQSKLCTLTCF